MVQQYIQTVTKARRTLADTCVYRLRKLHYYDGKINLGRDKEHVYWFENGSTRRGIYPPLNGRTEPIIIAPGIVPFLNLTWIDGDGNNIDGLLYVAEQIEMVWKKVFPRQKSK